MLQGHHPRKLAGQWRRTSIRITAPGDELATDYEGPDQERVPGLMSEFVDWLDGGDLDSHVLLRAAMAHLNLVKIHPWSDGNGRMSRSLQTLLIARGGVLAPEFSSIGGVPGPSTPGTCPGVDVRAGWAVGPDRGEERRPTGGAEDRQSPINRSRCRACSLMTWRPPTRRLTAAPSTMAQSWSGSFLVREHGAGRGPGKVVSAELGRVKLGP